VRKGEGWETLETYPCRGRCGLGTPQPNNLQRRALRCALPGFDESTWAEAFDPAQPRLFMGRLPIYGEPDVDEPYQDNPMQPRDDHRDGCPGAWYRCGFAASLYDYERHMTDAGFSANPLLDRCHDRLVLEAIQFLETERLRARAHWAEKRTAVARK
jgi:hypothetical protein